MVLAKFLKAVLFFTVILLVSPSFWLKLEAAPPAFHTYSQSKFNSVKAKLDRSGRLYNTKSNKVSIEIHYIYWGPFLDQKTLLTAIGMLKRYNFKYKFIKGHYLYLGAFPDFEMINRLKKKLDPSSYTPFRVIAKQKKLTRFTITLKSSSLKSNENDDVIVLSPPPQKLSPPNSQTTDPVSENRLKGDLIISTQYFHQKKDFLTLFFAQPTYNLIPLNSTWEGHLGVSLNLSTKNMQTFDNNIIEPHKTYFSYNKNSTSFTLGYQVISWGRVFENSIIDRFNRLNLQVGPQLNLSEKSLSQLALRIKQYIGSSSLDLVYLPKFKPSSLPEEGEVWSPIDIKSQRILGVPANPILEQLITQGSYGKDNIRENSLGARLNTNVFGVETGFTIIKSPQLVPYYQINQETISYIAAGQPVNQAIASSQGSTFTKKYPMQDFYAFDLSNEIAGTIYRLEVGYKNNTPVTTTEYSYKLMNTVAWNLSAEMYPRSGQDTLNIIFSGSEIETNKINILDQTTTQYLATRYLIKFAQDTIEFEFKARFGLHEKDIQILPEISYMPIDNHQFTFGAAYFQGSNTSLGGFYKNYNHVSLRWKYSY